MWNHIPNSASIMGTSTHTPDPRISDHKPVTYVFRPLVEPNKGSTYWKLNSNHLEEEEPAGKIKTIMESFLRSPSALVWELGETKIDTSVQRVREGGSKEREEKGKSLPDEDSDEGAEEYRETLAKEFDKRCLTARIRTDTARGMPSRASFF